jgi:tetratricopeptide (TPR) repeat protein
LLEQFKNKFDDKELYALLKMASLYKDKKYSEAEKVLREIVNTPNSEYAKYYLLQILLIQDKIKDAVELIKTLNDYSKFRVGLISALVTLYKKQNNRDEITSLFNNSINNLTRNDPNSKDLEIFIKENSNYQIESGNYQQACEMLEKMRSLRPNDFKILSKLINVYSKFDTEKANRFLFFFVEILFQPN